MPRNFAARTTARVSSSVHAAPLPSTAGGAIAGEALALWGLSRDPDVRLLIDHAIPLPAATRNMQVDRKS